MAAGNPQVDKTALKFLKSIKAYYQPKVLTNLDESTLSEHARGFAHLEAEFRHYMNIRDRQGRSGLMARATQAERKFAMILGETLLGLEAKPKAKKPTPVAPKVEESKEAAVPAAATV